MWTGFKWRVFVNTCFNNMIYRYCSVTSDNICLDEVYSICSVSTSHAVGARDPLNAVYFHDDNREINTVKYVFLAVTVLFPPPPPLCINRLSYFRWRWNLFASEFHAYANWKLNQFLWISSFFIRKVSEGPNFFLKKCVFLFALENSDWMLSLHSAWVPFLNHFIDLKFN